MKLDTGALLFLFWPFDQLGWLGVVALLGIYGGVVFFFRGFRMLQHKRLVLDTPVSKIRSASIGLVEVSGMATGPQTIPAGITGEPCYYYRATAWQREESNSQRRWQKVAEESLCVPFFVDDGTGRMLVYPQGAQLDVHRNVREDYEASLLSSRDMVPESARKFLARHGIDASETVRLEQCCILPRYPVFVFGTLGENPRPGPWAAEPHVAAEPPANMIFNVPQVSRKSAFQTPSRVSTMVSVKTSRVVIPLRTSPSNPSTSRNQSSSQLPMGTPAPSFSATRKQIFTSVGSTNALRSVAPATMLTAVAERAGVASSGGALNRASNWPGTGATQERNVVEFDLHPHAAITKGERNEFFAISSQSQREVVDSLAWKAIACIWGGPIIALTCLCFLIADLM